MAKTMKEVMEKSKVKPVTNVSGTPVVSFEEQRDLAQEAIRDKIDVGVREFNPDGTLSKTLYHNAAVNMAQFYDNRYRLVENEMELVTAQTTDGYRAIAEQSTGRVFQKQVPVYVFARENPEDKKSALKFVRLDVVSDVDFIAEFTHKLSADAMKMVLPLIPVDASVAEETLPI